MTKVKFKYNFIKYKSINLNRYYDEENVVSLTIFESGWDDLYQCIEEWGEYGATEHYTYTAQQIYVSYGINAFLRKEKLNRINESIL